MFSPGTRGRGKGYAGTMSAAGCVHCRRLVRQLGTGNWIDSEGFLYCAAGPPGQMHEGAAATTGPFPATSPMATIAPPGAALGLAVSAGEMLRLADELAVLAEVVLAAACATGTTAQIGMAEAARRDAGMARYSAARLDLST